MRNTLLIAVVILALQCLPAFAEGSSIFDDRRESLNLSALIHEYSVPVPASPVAQAATEPAARRKMLYELLSEQGEAGSINKLTFQEIQLIIREAYGVPPSETQKDSIRQALALLHGTKFGRELCAAAAYECTLESLKKAGIVMLVKDSIGNSINGLAEVPPPVNYAGQTYIGIRKEFLDKGQPSLLGVTIGHEMSHIEDLNKNRLGTLSKAMYATEEKAFLNTLALYDEVSRKHRECFSPLSDVMLDFWKWKNEDGPYPKYQVFTLNVGGIPRVISTTSLMEAIQPAVSFLDGVKNLINFLYRKEYGSPSVNPKLVQSIRSATFERAQVYKQWRVQISTPAPLPQPQQPQQPQSQPQPHPQPPQQPQPQPQPQLPQQQPQQPSSDDGNDNNGDNGSDYNPGGGAGGSGTWPFNPNPNFGPGI